MSTLLASPQPQCVSCLSDPLPGEQLCSHQHGTDRGFADPMRGKPEQKELHPAGLGREKALCLPKQGVSVQLNQPLRAPSLLPPAEVLRTWGQGGLCSPAAPGHHKAALSQGSGCTGVLRVSPKVHRLSLSLKLCVWKESFMGTPLLKLYCPQACAQLQPGEHGWNCSYNANSVGVPRPPHFLWGSPGLGNSVCGCWTVPAGCLAPLPSLSSSSTGHIKKPFLPAEHRRPPWRNASCPATLLLILVSTHRSAMQHQHWVFWILGVYFMAPQKWFWRNVWSWIYKF